MSLDTIVEFVNTVDLEADEELFTDPSILGRWMNRRGLIGKEERITDQRDLAIALEFREALRQVLVCHHDQCEPPRSSLDVLEEAGRQAQLTVAFEADGKSVLAPRAAGIDGGLGRLLADAHAAELSGEWGKLKVCSNDGCRWAFYDESRNQSRRWCRMEICGNRAKVKAHRARRSA